MSLVKPDFTPPFFSEEIEPVTLQVVLLGSDGVVIASDTCRVGSNPRFRVTDSISKIVVKSSLAYTFAGDDASRAVGEAVVDATQSHELSVNLIDEIANKVLKKYKRSVRPELREAYRKTIFVQAEDHGFSIWSATYGARKLKVERHQPWQGKCSVYGGDESNPALYVYEYYYKQYPVTNVSALKKMSAHVILTARAFASTVNGLEIVVGSSNGFASVSTDEISRLRELSYAIHEANHNHFVEDRV